MLRIPRSPDAQDRAASSNRAADGGTAMSLRTSGAASCSRPTSPSGPWGRLFDDAMVAAAMRDRLLHRSIVFNITVTATGSENTKPATTNWPGGLDDEQPHQ